MICYLVATENTKYKQNGVKLKMGPSREEEVNKGSEGVARELGK